MGKVKELRRKTLLEAAAAERLQFQTQQKALIHAIGGLRSAMLEFAKGENWAVKHRHSWHLPGFGGNKIDTAYTWTGEGNPQDLADKAMAMVFGKDYREQVKEKG